MKWLKEGNISLHQQDLPEVNCIQLINRSISSSKNPTITSQYVSERLLQLLILHKLFSLTSCQKELEKEQPNKIWDVVSVN